MTGIGSINLKVAVLNSDFYARHAINAYLAWDRRTRVIGMFANLDEFWAAREKMGEFELPDAIVLDANSVGGSELKRTSIRRLRESIEGLRIICLAPFVDLDMIYAAAEAGAAAYLLEQDTRIHIAWAICHACSLSPDEILISAGVEDARRKLSHPRLRRAKCLNLPRRYIGMSRRVRQAIELFAVEGMPQRLVADEMGIGVNAVRGYIKDAYSILESSHEDKCDYPPGMNQQEIAFMRITALDIRDC